MRKYPYFAEDNTLNLRVVTDVRGNLEYLANCKKFGDVYLVKDVDIEYVGDKWIKKQQIIIDHETGKKVTSTYNLINGIVSIDRTTGKPAFGYFSPNPYTNCTVIIDGSQYTCINVDLLTPQFYVECKNNGKYYHIADYSSNKVQILRQHLNNADAPYNIEDHNGMFQQRKEYYANNTIPIDRDIRFAAPYIKDLTFGAELETITGTLPVHILNKYGIVICKDGSIRGGDGLYPAEFVTVPLQGAKGIQTLRNISREIAERSTIDLKCSYHLHIGGVKTDRLFLVSLFKLCTKIQNDVLLMFPFYKTKPEGIKSKNYCKKLPLVLNNYVAGNDFNTYINNTYTDIYCFLSGGKRPDAEFNHTTKTNPWGEGKWNIKTRYYWVNFVNLVFHKRETIEFRVHTPTLNSDKIINWLFMCAAIIKYAERYPKRCVSDKTIRFTDVLNYYKQTRVNSYTEMLSENLIAYYNSRVEVFRQDYQNGDYVSNHDIRDDKKFEFNVLKIK